MSHAFPFDRLPGAPWRPLEILAVLLGLMAAWPVAAAYVGWKLWRASRRLPAADEPASPFEAHRRATLDRLAEEERDYAEVLRELRRPRDAAEFERFAGGRWASA